MTRAQAARRKAPKLQFARPGANPTLRTIELVRAALKSAEKPVSRNELLRQLADWGHSTTRQSLNAALGFLGADGSIAEGSKGLVWVTAANGSLLEAIRSARTL